MPLLTLAALLGAWGAAPAEATSYRFWAYWLGDDDGWTFSGQGASRVPADGTVDGWRFAVSEASSSTIPPRHTPSFARICGSTEPVDGSKRVGLVVDFGVATDAPDGEAPRPLISECVVVDTDANGYEVLTAVAQIRSDAGLICGLNGYPAAECGAPVADPEPRPSSSPSDSGGRDGGQDATTGGGSSPGNGQTGEGQGDAGSGGDGGRDSKGKDGGKDAPGKDADDLPEGATPEPPGDMSPAAAAAADATTSPGAGSPAGLMVGLAVIAALVAAALVLRRRRA